jgi:hypothetical protein
VGQSSCGALANRFALPPRRRRRGSPRDRHAPLRARFNDLDVEPATRRLANAFRRSPAVAAFLDRLMHHSHLIEIRGKSYRLHEHSLTARSRKAKATT